MKSNIAVRGNAIIEQLCESIQDSYGTLFLSNGIRPVWGRFQHSSLRLHPQGIEFRVAPSQANVVWRLPKKVAGHVIAGMM